MSLFGNIKHMSVSDKAFGACIILVALIEAWNGALSESPKLAGSMPNLGLAAIWPFVPLGLLLLAGAIWVTKAIRHSASSPLVSAPNPFSQALMPIFRQKYTNETVDLDGKEFIECSFDSVTLRYEGTGPTRLTQCFVTQGKKLQVQSAQPVVLQTMMLLGAINKLGATIDDIVLHVVPKSRN